MHAAPDEAGGLLFDLGSHLIDQALLLFGPVRQRLRATRFPPPRCHVDDDTFVALTHDSGVRSHLWMSSVRQQPGPRFRLLGSDGAFVKYGLDVQEDALRAGLDPRRPDGGGTAARWGRLGVGDDTRTIATVPGDYPSFYRTLATAIRNGGVFSSTDGMPWLRSASSRRRSNQSVRPPSSSSRADFPRPRSVTPPPHIRNIVNVQTHRAHDRPWMCARRVVLRSARRERSRTSPVCGQPCGVHRFVTATPRPLRCGGV